MSIAISRWNAVLGSPDANVLAAFYVALLGWEIVWEEQGWVRLQAPGGRSGLSFQTESNYERPFWPEVPGRQQMMIHLDFAVDDMDAAAAQAIALGATLADQPDEELRVLIDPAGHPFCLFIPE